LHFENRGGGASNATWEKHRAEIRTLPDDLYHRDRFRAIRGCVTGPEGKPVAGALVRCARVESLVELAEAGAPRASAWMIPVEAQTTTGTDGTYEFPHLSVGARTFFYSSLGTDLAPAVKDLVVVQDGLGANLDVTLERPAALRIKFAPVPARSVVVSTPGQKPKGKPPLPTRLYLVPHRWWPTLPAAGVTKGQSSLEFGGLGGPFRRGLIAASGPDESDQLRVVGRYDLGESAEAVITGAAMTASPSDLPEAAGIDPWSFPARASQRLFYAAMSPIAVFWPAVGDDQPLRFVQSSYPFSPIVLELPSVGTGAVRGFAPHPLLPVLVESRSGGSWLRWTSEASEYEVSGLPDGLYRVRALDLFGAMTFASGASVRDGATSEPARLWAKVELDEPASREVMGLVRWESGVPAPRAGVFMQNTYNFRKYLRRVDADDQGFFRFVDVPGDEPYLVFAIPPGGGPAMRELAHFGVPASTREIWRDLTLHPHSISGNAPPVSSPKALFELVRFGSAPDTIVWTFRAEGPGTFTVSNVPHGRYRVHLPQATGGVEARSLPFDIGDGQSEAVVRWSSP
jgi:hypothetical protein